MTGILLSLLFCAIIICVLYVFMVIHFISIFNAPEKIFAFNLLYFFFCKINKPVPIVSVKSHL